MPEETLPRILDKMEREKTIERRQPENGRGRKREVSVLRLFKINCNVQEMLNLGLW